MQSEEQEATARSLPVFIYISQHFQLAAAAQQAGRETLAQSGRESERGFAAGHRGDGLSLFKGVCTHKLCLLWPEAERRRGSISIFLRLFLPHAVIYQEKSHGKVGSVYFSGQKLGCCVTRRRRGRVQRRPNTNL